MTYYSGMMPPSLTPASDFMDVLGPALLAEGFTLEAELGPGGAGSSGVTRANVYKSAAALNGVMDWYLVVRRTSDFAASSSIQLLVGEAFNGTLLTLYPPSTQSNLPEVDSYLHSGAGADLVGSTGTAFLGSPNVTRTGSEYLFSITPQRLIVNTRHHGTGAADDTHYAGLFDNMVYGWTLPNLGLFRVLPGGASSSAYGSCTREPFQTIAHAYNFFVYTGLSAAFGAGEMTAQAGDAYGGRSHLSKALIYSARVAGSPRGLLKDLYVTGTGSATLSGTGGVIAGDEIELHDMWGKSETLVALTSSYSQGFWMRKV